MEFQATNNATFYTSLIVSDIIVRNVIVIKYRIIEDKLNELCFYKEFGLKMRHFVEYESTHISASHSEFEAKEPKTRHVHNENSSSEEEIVGTRYVYTIAANANQVAAHFSRFL